VIDVFSRNCVYWPTHAGRGFRDSLHRGRELHERAAQVKEFSLLSDADAAWAPHGRLEFCLSLYKAKCFVYGFHRNLLRGQILTHKFVAPVPAAFRYIGESQEC
jgi:hypothetical protein